MICQANGCRKQARPRGRFCSSACRSRDWKARKSYGTSRPAPSSRNAAERRSGGLQVSFRKAVEVLYVELGDLPFPTRHEVEAALAQALPLRQRQRLESR